MTMHDAPRAITLHIVTTGQYTLKAPTITLDEASINLGL